MTMGSLVVFTLVTLVSFGSSYGQPRKFTGLMDLADRLFIEGFAFCGAFCTAPHLQGDANKTLDQCQSTFMTIADEMQQEGSKVYELENFYNFTIKRQPPSNSRLCRWAHRVDDCAGQLVKNHCDHDGIKREMNRMMQQAKAYVCYREPPVLQCVLHPDVVKDAFQCVQEQFGKYFNATTNTTDERLKQIEQFYNGEIKTDNSESQYTALRTLGTCLSTSVGKSPVQGGICSKAETLLNTQIKEVIDYFKKTDILKCTFDPELWRHMQGCGQTLGEALKDLASNMELSHVSNSTNPMSHFTEQFQQFVDDNYQLLKEPLKAFMTCTLQGIDTVCSKDTMYYGMQAQFKWVENIFSAEAETVPEECEASIKEWSNSASTSKTAVAHVAAAILLGILMTS